MKVTGNFFVALLFIISCRASCKEKIAHLYTSQHDVFAVEKKVNKFSLQMSYMPVSLLRRPDLEDKKTIVQDTAHYYFKLEVVCPENTAPAMTNTVGLLYQLDSLFTTGGEQPYANPVSVKPGVKDGGKTCEYLLVFDKKDFNASRQLTIVFFDRIFTNTKQVFAFDRTKIDELETLQCYSCQI
jgi:hypothetical protein